MSDTLLMTLGSAFRKARATNTTDASAPSRIPTATRPSGTGNAAAQTTSSVLDLNIQGNAAPVQNGLMLCPYGTGSDGNTGNLRVYNWRKLADPTLGNPPTNQVWIPILLCELAFTVSSGNPGVAGGLVVAGELFAKTITITTGNSNVSVEVLSPATTAILAHAVVDLKGPLLLEIVLWVGTLTDANCLWAFL